MFLKVSRNFLKTFSLFVLSFLIFTLAASALAATGDYVPLVQIPGIPAGANFLQYLSGIYNFLISIVGILAMASLVYGGFRYLTSVGNPAAVEDAKDIINSAIVGLVLALSSWLILNEINPDVLVLRKPGQIGALPGKYVYNQTNRTCVADTNPEGVPISGSNEKQCKCVDNPDKLVTSKTTASKTPTQLTISADSSSAAGQDLLIRGGLTNALMGSNISGARIDLNVINDNFNKMNTITDAATTDFLGDYLIATKVPTACVGTVRLQATFAGDTTYSQSVSNSTTLTVTKPWLGSVPDCAATDYSLPVTSSSSTGGSFCNQVCSNPNMASDTSYHCLKADLRVGKTSNDRTQPGITAKKDEILYFDADTFARHNYPIVAYAMNYENNFLSLFAFEKSCEVIPLPISCSFILTVGTPPPMNNPICNGINGNEHKYTATGVYRAMSRIWEQLPDGSCEVRDAEIPITIENY